MSKTNSHREEVQHLIVITAAQMVQAKGQEALSMRTLAAKLERSPASLYKYFANKAAILDAVRQIALQQMAEGFLDAEREGSGPLEKVRTACRAMIAFALQEPRLYLLIYNQPKDTRPNYKEIFKTFHFRYMQKQLHIANRFGLLNLPDGFNVELLVLQLWTCIHGVITLRQSLMANESIFTKVSDQMLDQMLENLENPKELWQVPYPEFAADLPEDIKYR